MSTTKQAKQDDVPNFRSADVPLPAFERAAYRDADGEQHFFKLFVGKDTRQTKYIETSDGLIRALTKIIINGKSFSYIRLYTPEEIEQDQKQRAEAAIPREYVPKVGEPIYCVNGRIVPPPSSPPSIAVWRTIALTNANQTDRERISADVRQRKQSQ